LYKIIVNDREIRVQNDETNSDMGRGDEEKEEKCKECGG